MIKLLLMSFFLLYAKFVISIPTPHQHQWDLRASHTFDGATYYGDNFTGAWEKIDKLGIKPGEGVNVAVIDTGYTDHPGLDGQFLTSGRPGQYGVSFVFDCRFSGYCHPSTKENEVLRRFTEFHDALDSGDFVSKAEKTDSNSVFYENQYQHCDETSSWHGTGMTGAIAGTGKNSLNIVGGAYGAKILPIRTHGKCSRIGELTPSGMIIYEPYIRWAAGLEQTNQFFKRYLPNQTHNVDIISISNYTPGTCHPNLEIAITEAIKKGKIVVASTNNYSLPNKDHYPANCRGVISVAAKNGLKKLASYSGFGQDIMISASSGDYPRFCNNLVCLVPSYISSSREKYNRADGFTYEGAAGASISTAYVSAAIANIISVLKKKGLWNPSNPNNQQIIKDILIKSADRFVPGGNCHAKGCVPDRVLNVEKAIDVAIDMLTPKTVGYAFLGGYSPDIRHYPLVRCPIEQIKNQDAIINTKNDVCQPFNLSRTEGINVSALRVSAKKNYLLAGTNKGLYICNLKTFNCERYSIGGVYEGGVTSISTPKVIASDAEIYFVTTEKGNRRFYKYSFQDKLNGTYNFNLEKSPQGRDYWYSDSWYMTYIDHAPTNDFSVDRALTAGYTTVGMPNRDISYQYFNNIGGYRLANLICFQHPYKFLHDYKTNTTDDYITAIMSNGDKRLKQIKILPQWCNYKVVTELRPRYKGQGEKYSDIKEFPFLYSPYIQGFYVANHDDMEFFHLNLDHKEFDDDKDMTIKKPTKPLMWDIKTMEFMKLAS